jgi:hypothetical protein
MKTYEIWSKGKKSNEYIQKQFDRCGANIWHIFAKVSRADGAVMTCGFFQCADTMKIESGALVFYDRHGTILNAYAPGSWEWSVLTDEDDPKEAWGTLMPRELEESEPEGGNITRMTPK